MNIKREITYFYEHRQCKAYEHEGLESQVQLVKLQKNEVYKQTLTDPIIVFCNGHIALSSPNEADERLEMGEFILLPPGKCISILSLKVDTRICVCRLSKEVVLCNSMRLEELGKHIPKEDTSRVLTANEPIRRFMDSFIPCIEDKLLCRHFVQMKISELLLLLRAYYLKEELAAFFLPLLGPDFMFRNFIYKGMHISRTVKEMAAEANMSERGFLKKFKKIMNSTPTDFMNRHKIAGIKHDLICSKIPIKEISAKYGFATVQAFTAYCHKNLGKTPAKIRKENNSV